jgi:hypothetical protein
LQKFNSPGGTGNELDETGSRKKATGKGKGRAKPGRDDILVEEEVCAKVSKEVLTTGKIRAKSGLDEGGTAQYNVGGGGGSGENVSVKKTTGKLKKTANVGKAGPSDAGANARTPLAEFALPAQPLAAHNLNCSPHRSLLLELAPEETLAGSVSRRTSISLSEYDFRPDSPSANRTESSIALHTKANLAPKAKAKRARSGSVAKLPRKRSDKVGARRTTDIDSKARPSMDSRRPSISLSEYELKYDGIVQSPLLQSADVSAQPGMLRKSEVPIVGEASEAGCDISMAGKMKGTDHSPSESISAPLRSPINAVAKDVEPPLPGTSVPGLSEVDRGLVSDTRVCLAPSADRMLPTTVTRKRTSKSTSSATAKPAKKSKKLAKSASIILNSDEPDLVTEAGTRVLEGICAAHPEPPPRAKPAVKPRKVVKKPTAASHLDGETHLAGTSAVHAAGGAGPQSIATNQAGGESAFDAYLNAWSQPAYPNNEDNANCQALPLATTEDSMQSVFYIDAANTDSSPPRPAPLRRRRSWTPRKNTELSAVDTPGVDVSNASPESPAPGLCLAALVSAFGYHEEGNEVAQHDRTTTSEAVLKRKRVELAPESIVGAAARKAHEAAMTKPAKRVKGVKKKPQTITELATKAYRNEPEPSAAQPTVSEFFAQQAASHPNAEGTAGVELRRWPRRQRSRRRSR